MELHVRREYRESVPVRRRQFDSELCGSDLEYPSGSVNIIKAILTGVAGYIEIHTAVALRQVTGYALCIIDISSIFDD